MARAPLLVYWSMPVNHSGERMDESISLKEAIQLAAEFYAGYVGIVILRK